MRSAGFVINRAGWLKSQAFVERNRVNLGAQFDLREFSVTSDVLQFRHKATADALTAIIGQNRDAPDMSIRKESSGPNRFTVSGFCQNVAAFWISSIQLNLRRESLFLDKNGKPNHAQFRVIDLPGNLVNSNHFQPSASNWVQSTQNSNLSHDQKVVEAPFNSLKAATLSR